jgi:hypothetical protein
MVTAQLLFALSWGDVSLVAAGAASLTKEFQ